MSLSARQALQPKRLIRVVVAPKAIRTMESHAYFRLFFARLREELRTMHAAYAQWQTLEVFGPLKKLADDLLKFAGIDIQAKPDGTAYVAFPFTAETIPSAAERMGFLAGRTPSERKWQDGIAVQ